MRTTLTTLTLAGLWYNTARTPQRLGTRADLYWGTKQSKRTRVNGVMFFVNISTDRPEDQN